MVEIAINEASILLLMVDVTTGLIDLDDDIIDRLRRIQKGSSSSSIKWTTASVNCRLPGSFHRLLRHTHFVSSITGSGTGELLDEVVAMMPADDSSDAEEEEVPRIAIVGQPNVGKSTLLNALIGEERNIVTDIAGTTRDTIHTVTSCSEKTLFFIDTAGIRKRNLCGKMWSSIRSSGHQGHR